MGFLFGLIGALAGAWIISEWGAFFGFLVGMLIGWLLHRLVLAQENIKRLLDRVDLLEQRNTTTESSERLAKKTFDTPPSEALYEPTPAVSPPVEESPPTVEESVPEVKPALVQMHSTEPDVIVHERTPAPQAEPGIGEHTIEVAKRWLTTGNVPVKVGVIISFLGVAFLLKYAVEKQVFSIPMSVR